MVLILYKIFYLTDSIVLTVGSSHFLPPCVGVTDLVSEKGGFLFQNVSINFYPD